MSSGALLAPVDELETRGPPVSSWLAWIPRLDGPAGGAVRSRWSIGSVEQHMLRRGDGMPATSCVLDRYGRYRVLHAMGTNDADALVAA